MLICFRGGFLEGRKCPFHHSISFSKCFAKHAWCCVIAESPFPFCLAACSIFCSASMHAKESVIYINIHITIRIINTFVSTSTIGLVVEYVPATDETRVRFSDGAEAFCHLRSCLLFCHLSTPPFFFWRPANGLRITRIG